MSKGTVTVERVEHVSVVTLRRPAKRNALNDALWSGLREAADTIRTDLPRAVVITGEGEAFCAGMDLAPDNPQMAGLAQAAQTHELGPMRELLAGLRPFMDAFVTLPVPTIAAINGLAFGGGAELAVRCDLRVMDPDAELCFSEVRLGLMPDMGGGVALTRIAGPAVAADLILSARRIRGQEAARLGVVNRVSAPGKCLDEAVAFANEIAANGPRAVRASLAVIRRTPDLSQEEALDFEREQAVHLMASGECIHGVAALMSRSKPDFPNPQD